MVLSSNPRDLWRQTPCFLQKSPIRGRAANQKSPVSGAKQVGWRAASVAHLTCLFLLFPLLIKVTRALGQNIRTLEEI